uniref:Uncharacterized protein n=1 Tax=viral metagenome TaxID=1070528 RepID=A0A6C0EMI6_9ZZZZ
MFSYLIINHFILTTKEGLENSCKTPSDTGSGCKTVAVQKNIQAASYTKTIMANTKKEILALMDKVSKLITSEEAQMNNNTKGIKLNVKHVTQMADSLNPDK